MCTYDTLIRILYDACIYIHSMYAYYYDNYFLNQSEIYIKFESCEIKQEVQFVLSQEKSTYTVNDETSMLCVACICV